MFTFGQLRMQIAVSVSIPMCHIQSTFTWKWSCEHQTHSRRLAHGRPEQKLAPDRR